MSRHPDQPLCDNARSQPGEPVFNQPRNRRQASHDPALVAAILDAGMVGHFGFVAGGRPMVIPMAYARGPGCIWLHGGAKARITRMADNALLSMTVTLLDGIVAARSGYHHAMNYRSVVVHGRGRRITEEAERDAALDAIINHLLPGRSREIRAINAQERKATGVFALDIEAASVKQRAGPPIGDPADDASGSWAGVIPIITALGRGLPDAVTAPALPEPPSAKAARQRFAI
ncbi:MAG: pyridoxamine 5'-phosphate oxidase family protein [Porphyrobacter sp.]|jgi:hypothetical protein|nr:pyridoxamine 5'-phosphate oxidase family protein [Porphyrobacter sp.]